MDRHQPSCSARAAPGSRAQLAADQGREIRFQQQAVIAGIVSCPSPPRLSSAATFLLARSEKTKCANHSLFQVCDGKHPGGLRVAALRSTGEGGCKRAGDLLAVAAQLSLHAQWAEATRWVLGNISAC
jgi:hypothetical protein